MNMMTELAGVKLGAPLRAAMRIAGESVGSDRVIEVRNPYTKAIVGTVPKATIADVRRAFAIAKGYRATLTRYERAQIMYRTAELIRTRANAISDLITAESGLCKKDSSYEVGRACDVFTFAGNAALQDDGQVFSCDLTPHGKSRKVYTLREPLLGVISAITPFNHPLNQVAHKIAPAIATNNRMVLKPTEKTPLSALLLADLLYEAGLPPPMLSVVTGDPREIADEMLVNPDVDLVTFTGGVPIGKYIAATAVYKRQVLELGGNDPLIVMEDADLDEAASLAAAGSYKNSGQRCTAVKRMLVHERVADAFVERLVARTQAWTYGDPADPAIDMGTVIDVASAINCETRVNDAVAQGAKLLAGNVRRRAVFAHRHRPRPSRNERREDRNVRPGVAGDPFPRYRRRHSHFQRHRVRIVVVGMHQPARLHHAFRDRVAGRHGQHPRGARLPARTNAVRRHQRLRAGLQGRRAGSDEELHQHQDVFAAMVTFA
jgi:aldehyde dehydrogenase (NAD+)